MTTYRIRPHLRDLSGYVPGEQPRDPEVVKLNTNENPYPPSPRVQDVLRSFDASTLRLYPDATAEPVRRAVAGRFGTEPDRVFVGNGSDEILALLTRLFLGPGDRLAVLDPSYSLYPVLARIQDASIEPHVLDGNFALPDSIRATDAPLLMIANPNAPTGSAVAPERILEIAESVRGVVVVDEAYAEFAEADCMEIAGEHPRVMVVRTLSKSHGLAGLRLGYAVGPRPLVERLLAVKDSYNVDAIAQAVAVAALEDPSYTSEVIGRIRRTRDRVAAELRRRGFDVVPSEANFLFARPARMSASGLYNALRARRILVRHFDAPRVREYVRITVGTDREMDAFLRAVEEIEP